MDFPIMSSRCSVHIQDDRVIKSYVRDSSFDKEVEAYSLLEGKQFIPRLIEKNYESKYIIIEKIDAPTISEFIEKNGIIPINFAEQMRTILVELMEANINITTEILKHDHIYIVNSNKIPNTYDVRIIDFDVYDKITSDFQRKFTLQEIDSYFGFVKDREDESSKQQLRDKFYEYGATKQQVEEFFNNI